MKMARYVIANRRAGKFSAAAKATSRAEVATVLASMPFASIVHDKDPADPLARRVTVVEADPGAMAAYTMALPPDVIVEPEIFHYREWPPPRDVVPFRRQGAAPTAADTAPFVISVTGGGQPLPFATVKLYVRGFGSTVELTGQTDAAGQVHFRVPLGHQPSVAVVAPLSAFWSMVVRGAGLQHVIECPPLPFDGPLGWWHNAVGLDNVDPVFGNGIRVGVADTGLGPHPDLAHAVAVGAFIDGDVLGADQIQDVDSHGTHVAGTIGARPTNLGTYSGLAPGCELFAARVFPSAEAGASNADIANAIDALSRTHHVDLINLSLGASVPSEVVHDAIIDAAERGTLCLCAAGNDAGPVNYPAAFPEAVAVSALGLAGWGPPGSLSASRIPLDSALFGRENLYAANFTSHGPQVVCGGPGVGIIAAVPDRHGVVGLYAVMDGTSMATPVTCGALAAVLSRDPGYQAMPRDIGRSQAARGILQAILRDVGLPPSHCGWGIPFARQAVV
jgi:subtilisin